MLDFTLAKYEQLMLALQRAGYEFVFATPSSPSKLEMEKSPDLALRTEGAAGSVAPTIEIPRRGEGVCKHNTPRVSLRHDVDARPEAAVQMAELEHKLGLRATYYFRAREAYRHPFNSPSKLGSSFNSPPKVGMENCLDLAIRTEGTAGSVVPTIELPEGGGSMPSALRRIISLGHEIGYHYEDLSLADGNPDLAWQHFCDELSYLRHFYPVHSACMHGAPRSRYDGRDLWQHYDYRQAGIDFEPYLDLDFSQILYLTDTGRRWDGYRVSVRDKILNYQEEWNRQGWSFHSTDDIIRAAEAHRLPARLMLSTHPQRWAVTPPQWLFEATTQPLKNILKRLLILRQS